MSAPEANPALGYSSSLPHDDRPNAEEERISQATQLQLTWWRFRRHRLAVISGVVVLLFYLVTVLADFLATSDPHATNARRSFIPPQEIHLFDDGAFRPHVFGLTGRRDPRTFRLSYAPDATRKLPITFFAKGYSYRFLGLFETERHLIGVQGRSNDVDGIFPLGTDQLGRDVWSRLMLATRVSLLIGLAGVGLSFVLGVLLGGISGLYGGAVDSVIQRVIEVLHSIPTIPLWMGLAAALPPTWSTVQIYFAITLIISLIGWTDLARVVRGRFMALRGEDFVLAAELAGASQTRIVLRHLLPSFTSHLIASVTLALPAMIISETALSFLGLGLRPPAISWGILLQDAQNVQTLVLAPWLLVVAVPVIVAILAFNFLGDGLRDAADPYGD
ncbi:MAG: binding-protein-dependent transport system inner rane protein [Roseomonas sp.]|nr:binding-protein-dependent transport system inner rane protein [Roseomonas sp.]